MLKLAAQLSADGDVRALVESVMEQIRKAPGRADLRVSLFQLLCVTGDWSRALKMLASAAALDKTSETMARAYREIICCEVYREQVFQGHKSPLLLGEPQDWFGNLTEALRLLSQGHTEQAAQLRNTAFEAAPATRGTIDGTAFDWIADADSRLGPIFEAFVNGKYYWIPFNRIRQIKLDAPVDLRDLVWLPAEITFVNSGTQVAFVPVRYVMPLATASNELLLSRRTEWQTLADDTYCGLGQRMLTSSANEHPLLDVRLIELNA